MEDLEVLLVPLIIMGIVAAPFIWLLLRWSKSLSTCPVCKEKGAMNQTGNEEIREFTKKRFYETQCKYCGHSVWEEDNSESYDGPDIHI